MNQTAPVTCLVCQGDDSNVPLISFRFRNSDYWICSQHLPILIHHPGRLAGILPGAEDLKASEHHD